LPYVRALANLGVDAALQRDAGLAAGVNVRAGAIVHEAVAAGLARTRRLSMAA
jgi:alanine dehydrogenase